MDVLACGVVTVLELGGGGEVIDELDDVLEFVEMAEFEEKLEEVNEEVEDETEEELEGLDIGGEIITLEEAEFGSREVL